MIIDARIETRSMGDNRVLDYLRQNGLYRCIDFGGVQRPWASTHVTTYVDLVSPKDWEKLYPGMYDDYPQIWESRLIQADCEDAGTWAILADNVLKNGRFDFAISTHMIEHLANPKVFLELLPTVADRGYIGVPNKVFELGRGREFTEEGIKRLGLNGSYRGAFPHRWIFTVKGGTLWLFPKLGALEFVDFGWEDDLEHYKPLDCGQLGFFWINEIPIRLVTDEDIDFPNPQKAIDFYRKELRDGL